MALKSFVWGNPLVFFQIRIICLFLVLLCISSNSTANNGYSQQELEFPNGSELSISEFPSDGESLVIWIPSEYGVGPGQIPVSLSLAALGHDVWVLKLHESYMLTPGRTSLDEVPDEDLQQLLQLAKERNFSKVTFASEGRGCDLALRAAGQWEQDNPDSSFLTGFLFAHPHLLENTPQIGEKGNYLDTAKTVHLPTYYIQPQFSTKYLRAREIADVLATGGSQVFIHTMPGVNAGFHVRPPEDLNKLDLEMRGRLPWIYSRAIELMQTLPRSSPAPALQAETQAKKPETIREAALYPFKNSPDSPPLRLPDMDGTVIDIKDYTGEVVLVNFWATWCKPCVEEIPSLTRLIDRMESEPFKVLTVNINEPRPQIDEFLKSIKINFPILLASDEQSVQDWQVYAYPSNYLIDAEGKIRYGYRGALEWDAEHVIATIEQLLPEKKTTN